MKSLEIIQDDNVRDFSMRVGAFLSIHKTYEVKFQRNLFYAGIGSSAGHTPGSTQDLTKAKLDESWVAFIVYKEKR